MRILLIDDIRNELSPQVNRKVSVIARDYNEAIMCLIKLGPWDLVLFDHDLASFEDPDNPKTEKTGYDIVCWLEEYPEFMPKDWEVISSNPVGREKMQKVLEAIDEKR